MDDRLNNEKYQQLLKLNFKVPHLLESKGLGYDFTLKITKQDWELEFQKLIICLNSQLK